MIPALEGVLSVAVACNGYTPHAAEAGTVTDQLVVRFWPAPSELAVAGPVDVAVQAAGTVRDTVGLVTVPLLALVRTV